MPSEKQIRAALRRVGSRRARLRREREKLIEDTSKALMDARGVVPITEAAELADLKRTAVYQTYGVASGGRAKKRGARG